MYLATQDNPRRARGFTLIELLVVISIISLLISILLPSLSRAREQAKSLHCLARLKEFGNSLGAYENTNAGAMPPPRWFPEPADLYVDPHAGQVPGNGTGRPVEYGWAEPLFAFTYLEPVNLPESYPAQRNLAGRRWEEYFVCKSAADNGPNSGHYRVYLPSWSYGTFVLEPGGRYGDSTRATPHRATQRDRIKPRMPLMGDANELSERGDGFGDDDCSYIDAGEADYAGSDGRTNGNRFSDRHYGGTNFLFQDLHARWDTQLRSELARDFDLNSVIDIRTAP